MKKTVLFLSLFLLFLGQLRAQGTPLKVACIGNSITFGFGIKDRANHSYPSVLARLLGSRYEVRNFGFSARTLLQKGDHPYMKEQMFQDALQYQPDIVVIKLGTNDSKPINWIHKKEFTADLETMIHSFQHLASHPQIYVCLPSKAYSRRFGINDSIIVHEITPQIQLVANKNRCTVIDLHTATEGIPELYPDEIHPNAKGAAILAENVYKALTPKKRQYRTKTDSPL